MLYNSDNVHFFLHCNYLVHCGIVSVFTDLCIFLHTMYNFYMYACYIYSNLKNMISIVNCKLLNSKFVFELLVYNINIYLIFLFLILCLLGYLILILFLSLFEFYIYDIIGFEACLVCFDIKLQFECVVCSKLVFWFWSENFGIKTNIIEVHGMRIWLFAVCTLVHT